MVEKCRLQAIPTQQLNTDFDIGRRIPRVVFDKMVGGDMKLLIMALSLVGWLHGVSAVAETVRVMSPGLPVKILDAPDINKGTELERLNHQDEVTLVEPLDIYAAVIAGEEWVKVQTSRGIEGWVLVFLLEKIDPEGQTRFAVRKGASAKLMSKSNFGSSSEILEIVKPGTEVDVIDSYLAMRRVRLETGTTGWISRYNLQPVVTEARGVEGVEGEDRVKSLAIVIEGLQSPLLLTLDWEAAPNAAARLVQLAEDDAYDDTLIHRYSDGLSIDFGDVEFGKRGKLDRDKVGSGRSAYPWLPHEVSTAPMTKGSVIMLAGQDGSNSQFGILLDDAPYLKGNETRVGQVSGPLSQLVRMKSKIKAGEVFVKQIIPQHENEGMQIFLSEKQEDIEDDRAALQSAWGSREVHKTKTLDGKYEVNYASSVTVPDTNHLMNACTIDIDLEITYHKHGAADWIRRVEAGWSINLRDYFSYVLAEEDRYAYDLVTTTSFRFAQSEGVSTRYCRTQYAPNFSGPDYECGKKPYLEIDADKIEPIKDALFSMMYTCNFWSLE